MDDRIKESISALMDGEANELEFQRVLSHADQDEVSAVWSTYHDIKAVIEPEKGSLCAIDISQSVAAAIAKESPLELTGEHNKKQLGYVDKHAEISEVEDLQGMGGVNESSKQANVVTKYSGGFAVAASLFFALVFVLQNGINNPLGTEGSSFTSEVALLNTSNQSVYQKANLLTAEPENLNKQPKIIVEFTEEHAQRFNEYLLRHAEHSVASSHAGMIPLARVASVNAVGI